MSDQISDKNLFMMCRKLNHQALSDLPTGYHIRNCTEQEIDLWKGIHFDDRDTARQYYDFMTGFFNNVYASKASQFFRQCLFVCDSYDNPVGTCFVWKAYNKINTIHWYKVLKDYEGQGIGRALLSEVIKDLPVDAYPVYLHTQPSSFRAIKLYSDFGFCLLADPVIGNRKNDLYECLPWLEDQMYPEQYKNLKICRAPHEFLKIVASASSEEF